MTLGCKLCGQPVQMGERLYREVTGWEEIRKQGGTNAVRLRRLTGDVAHWACVERAASGLTGQDSIFDT